MKPERVCLGDYLQGKFVKVGDPNGQVVSQCPGNLDLDPVEIPFAFAHVQEAVSAAKQSFPSWRGLKDAARQGHLTRFCEMLRQQSEQLAWHISFEVGKPLWESREEVRQSLLLCDYFLKHGNRTATHEEIADADEASTGVIRFHARGVAVVISTALEPLYCTLSHLIPALINGNTAVVKSPRLAPLVGQTLAGIAHESGLPAGVFNLIHGDGELARRLTMAPEVDLVLFTGSYEVALQIRRHLALDFWKVMVLETGGKNSIVVWDDCNYERTLYEAFYAAFSVSGQRCHSASRMIVHESLFDRFVDDFHRLAKKCQIGFAGGTPEPFMGPVISEAAMENYLRYQGIAVREGCEEIMRGKTLDRPEKGYYVSPSIHTVPRADAKSVYQKSEIPGPNVAVYRARDLEEATEHINLTQHGLVASVYTASRENYLRLLDGVKVGLFHWNRPTTANVWSLPHGGVKKSGNCRPMGQYAWLQCTFPVSSLESKPGRELAALPAAIPRLEPAK